MPLSHLLRLPLFALLSLLLAGCGNQESNFTQIEGFEKIRSALPDTAANTAEQKLLRQYQPQLFIDNDTEGPLNFYQDYIGDGILTTAEGTINNPTAAQLNQHKHDPAAYFRHHGESRPSPPVAYGNVSYSTVELPGLGNRALTFLSYHFTFRASGLPAGISPWQQQLINLVADSKDWHQLDHYTAVFIVLENKQPRAVILQQHNYMRTYLIGGEHFTAGETIKIDAAISSNELYPHNEQRRQWRSAGFMSANTINHLLALEDSNGIYSSYDITNGKQQVDYQLQFLPANDAFYTFEGYLGEKRILPGRDGPPGAMYRTLPQLCPLPLALSAFYWTEGDREYAEILHNEEDPWNVSETAITRYKERFANAWAEQFGNEVADANTMEE